MQNIKASFYILTSFLKEQIKKIKKQVIFLNELFNILYFLSTYNINVQILVLDVYCCPFEYDDSVEADPSYWFSNNKCAWRVKGNTFQKFNQIM